MTMRLIRPIFSARLPLSLLLMLVALPASAQSEEEVRQLDQRCEAARQVALAPLRERMVRECERSRPRAADPRQECTVEMSTWGDNRVGPNGNVIRGMFYDLPECRQAQEAWQKWEANRPWHRQ